MTDFSPLDFRPLHTFTAKDMMPIVALPPGPTQLIGIAYLLRSQLKRKDRKRFDNLPIDSVFELVESYLAYSREYSEVLIERDFYATNARGSAG